MTLAAVALGGAGAFALYGHEHRALHVDAGAQAPPPSVSWQTPVVTPVPVVAVDDARPPAPGEACDTDADCAEVFSCCDGFCVDPSTDALNCGRCDHVCSTGVACEAGACALACDQAPCPPAYACDDLEGDCIRSTCGGVADGESCLRPGTHYGTCCGEVCVDIHQDSAHCAGCDNTCGEGEFCNDGNCMANVDCRDAGGATCALGPERNGLCCNGRCLDGLSDEANCGGCGKTCAHGEVCNQGECAAQRCEGQPSDATCLGADGGSNGSCCGGRCLSVGSFLHDVDNCGSCKAHCPQAMNCVEGICADPDGGRAGGCDRRTCPSDQVCTADGTCMRRGCNGANDNDPCAESSELTGVCCNQVCADISVDQANCGHCGERCDGGELCQSARCTPFTGCGAGGAQVCPLSSNQNGICCEQACVDPQADPGHCGSCDQSCSAGYGCVRGVCRVQDCAQSQSGEPCVAPGGGDAECCHGQCVSGTSLETDSQNCGDCGVVCPRGMPCEQGECTDLDSGGAFNCDDSGCPSGQTCIGGSHCTPLSCSGLADGLRCAGRAAESFGTCCGGACVDPRVDSQNCGLCGQACAQGQFCANGTCLGFDGCGSGVTLCPFGADHEGLCCAGACTDIEADPQNCGQCGNVCPPGVFCANFDCQVITRDSSDLPE